MCRAGHGMSRLILRGCARWTLWNRQATANNNIPQHRNLLAESPEVLLQDGYMCHEVCTGLSRRSGMMRPCGL